MGIRDRGIGDATPGGTCTVTTYPAVECTSVPIGTQVGPQDIFGKVGTDSKVDTGEDVNVTQGEISGGDVPALVIACDPTTEGTTTCRIQLDDDQTLPGDFKLGGGGATPGGNCTIDGNNIVICTNVPVDNNNPGEQPIFVKIGSNTPVDSGEEVYIIIATDIGKAVWAFNPGKGSTAPLFKSNDDITVTTKDFINLHDPALEDTYTCTIEARIYQPDTGTDAYETLGTNISYNNETGCSADLTKAIRGTKLNWSVKTTITNTNNSLPHEFDNGYGFRYQGSGVIF